MNKINMNADWIEHKAKPEYTQGWLPEGVNFWDIVEIQLSWGARNVGDSHCFVWSDEDLTAYRILQKETDRENIL